MFRYLLLLLYITSSQEQHCSMGGAYSSVTEDLSGTDLTSVQPKLLTNVVCQLRQARHHHPPASDQQPSSFQVVHTHRPVLGMVLLARRIRVS